MRRLVTPCIPLGLFIALFLVLPSARAPRRERTPSHELRDKLTTPVVLKAGIPPQTMLKDALELLTQEFGLTCVVDRESFRRDLQIDDIGMQPVEVPPSPSVCLDAVLGLVAKQLGGAYRICDGTIEITTLQQMGISWQEAGSDPSWLPLVNVSFEKRSLQGALQDLADSTGTNIIMDTIRLGDKAREPVSATLECVGLATAVRLLADQLDLKVVLVDNVLYVTTAAKADALQADLDRRLQPRLQLCPPNWKENPLFPGVVSGLGSGSMPLDPPRGPIVVRQNGG